MGVESPERYPRYRRYVVNLGRFYQKKKARIYTGIVFSILTVAFFLFFAIRPTLVTIASLLKEIEDKRVIAEKLEDKINALNSAQIEYRRVEKDLYLVDEALPVAPNVSLFVRQLEALARKHNVVIDSLQFEAITLKSEVQTGETGQETSFSLAVTGNYSQLKSFLETLTRLRRMVLVDDFTFESGEEGEELVLSLNAKAHCLTYSVEEQ